MELRYGESKDAKALAEIGAKTFYDAYVNAVDLENLMTVIKETFSEGHQLEEINHPETIFLVAEEDGKMAGYAKLNMNASNEHVNGGKSLELSRIYLLQEFIGKGIGRELMQRCIDEARQRGCDSLWLGVWEHNRNAIDFYRKLGFREVGSHAFKFGNETQTDLIMELEP
jgi:diamine N-acetyltransferase